MEHTTFAPTKTLENIPQTDDSYQLAWKLLEEENDDPARFRHDSFNELLRERGTGHLKKTYDRVESLLRILE